MHKSYIAEAYLLGEQQFKEVYYPFELVFKVSAQPEYRSTEPLGHGRDLCAAALSVSLPLLGRARAARRCVDRRAI